MSWYTQHLLKRRHDNFIAAIDEDVLDEIDNFNYTNANRKSDREVLFRMALKRKMELK